MIAAKVELYVNSQLISTKRSFNGAYKAAIAHVKEMLKEGELATVSPINVTRNTKEYANGYVETLITERNYTWSVKDSDKKFVVREVWSNYGLVSVRDA